MIEGVLFSLSVALALTPSRVFFSGVPWGAASWSLLAAAYLGAFMSGRARTGRLALFFLYGALVSYFIPLTYQLTGSEDGNCTSSGPWLCIEQVKRQALSLPSFMSSALGVLLLNSVGLVGWIDTLERFSSRHPRLKDAVRFIEQFLLAAATAIYDYENIVRSRLRSVAMLQESYEHGGKHDRTVMQRLRRRWHSEAAQLLARVEIFTSTGLELFESFPREGPDGPRPESKGIVEGISRYRVEELRSFYQAFSMSEVVAGPWHNVIARTVGPQMVVADVGAGTGRLLPTLVGLQAQVVAFEPDPAFHVELERLAQEEGCGGRIQITRLPFATQARRFDVIILMNNVLLEMLAEEAPETVIARLAGSLKSGGALLFDYPDRKDLDQSAGASKTIISRWADADGSLQIDCVTAGSVRVEAQCVFSFAQPSTLDHAGKSARLEWLEVVNWYGLEALEQAMVTSGLRRDEKLPIDVRTVAPANMFLYKYSYGG